MNLTQLLLPAIEHFHIAGYWIALLAALLETTIGIGLFLPGSTIILLMGALAAKGYFDLGDLIWFAAIGAVIGDNINYFIGKRYGSKIFAKGFWFIKPKHFKKGEKFFEHHGSKSIFFGRFIPSIKEVIPLIAGTFGMKQLPFIVWNILGAIGWSLIWILPGYFFAQSLGLAKIWLTRTGFFLAILLALFIIFYILKIIFIRKGKEFFSFLSSIWQSVKLAIIKNQEAQKFARRHKKIFQFIKKRTDKNNFFGLPLTLLSIALLYTISLLGGVMENIINSDIIVSADIRTANLLAVFRDAGLIQFFVWATLLGKWQIIIIFTITALLVLWLWKKQYYLFPLLLSIIGSETFISIGKTIFHRPRPKLAVYAEQSFSFPSGHAAIAVAFYGFLTYILIKNTKQWKRKVNIFFITLGLVILIGFSRLYLGVHYLSDIWGGYLVGIIWLIIAVSLSEYLSYKKQNHPALRINTKKRLATIGIIISSIVLYVIFALNYQLPVSTPPQKANRITVNNITTIFNTGQLKYTETLLGGKQEPLNFIILAKNNQQLINLFKEAGWFLADDVNVPNVIKLAKAVLWRSEEHTSELQSH